MTSYRIRQHRQGAIEFQGPEHISPIIDDLMNAFERAIEEEIERYGGFCGAVRPEQRSLSWTLDRLAHERDADSLDDRP